MAQDLLPDFAKRGGLVTAIAQDHASGEVLMVAYMNEASFRETLACGEAVYWSTSRNELWRKGETSGNTQRVRELWVDCDGDAVVLKVEQKGGAACHTGRRTCLYRRRQPDGSWRTMMEPVVAPAKETP
jgi:phosphoribosyl-AMP cyclohydrolase